MASSLLCTPLLDEESETKLVRASCSYKDLSGSFRVSTRSYKKQYAHIYAVRLMAMRKALEKVAKTKWDGVPIRKLADVKIDSRCCVVGTLFKRMELRPSILKEVSEKQGQPTMPAPERFISDSDSLVLEDETQRIPLAGNLPVDISVTGTVIALMGKESSAGTFEVERYAYCGLPSPKSSLRIDPDLEGGDDRYVVLVSGLGLGGSRYDALATQMLIDTITGELGGLADQKLCSQIIRVIVAGNSLSSDINSNKERESKIITRKIDPLSVGAIKELDDLLAQLACSVPVDLMPGANDPTNYTLPQQPLHKCMFPQSVVYPTLNGVPNPYRCNVGGRRFLGTSGQSVDDIYRFSGYDDRMEILKHTLFACHLAPTAPDTLGCYPFPSADPFLIEECPDVYFAGNQPVFTSEIISDSNGQSSLLVLVPDFSLTHQSVLINLRTLDCRLLTFGTDLSGGSRTDSTHVDTDTEPMDES